MLAPCALQMRSQLTICCLIVEWLNAYSKQSWGVSITTAPFLIRLVLCFEVWRLGVGPKRRRTMWKLAFLAAIWTIWKESNARCFEGKSSDDLVLREKVKLLVAHWVTPLPYFNGILVNSIVNNWKEVAFFTSPPSMFLA